MKIQTPRLKAYHAISPESKFTCPPCCIRQKAKLSQGAQTHTYCSILDSRAKIQLFSDSVGTKRAKPSPTVANAGMISYPIPESSQPIVHIDVLPSLKPSSMSEDLFDIIAVHHDGEIRCLSGDLRREMWCTSIASLIAADDVEGPLTTTLCVQYSTLIDDETAGKGLLKGRADLQAMLGVDIASGSADGHATVLFLVTSPQNHDASSAKPMTVHMFALQGTRSTPVNGSLTTRGSSLLHMHSVTLPEPSESESVSQQSSQILLHASSGTLYHGSDKSLRIYDLSGTVPKRSSYLQFGQSTNGVTSFLRLSSSSIITASSTALTIQDANYRSVQAIYPLSIINTSKKTTGTAGTKDYPVPPVRLLFYFSQVGLVLAMSDKHDLLAFQITLPHSILGGQRKRKRDGLLIDSIGRGIQGSGVQSSLPSPIPPSLGKLLPSRAVHDPHWQEVMATLDEYATEERIDVFETLILLELGVVKDPQWAADRAQVLADSAANQNKKNSKTRQATSTRDQQSTNDQIAPSLVQKGKVLYILEKMFSFADEKRQLGPTTTSTIDTASSLKVVFFPFKLFMWLVQSGNLSASNVELALRHKNLSSVPPTLPTGALTESILEYDPSLHLIMVLLKSPVYLDVVELTHLVKSLLQILKARERTRGALLRNGERDDVNGEMEDMSQCGAVAAEYDFNSKPEDPPSLHRLALIAALLKLYSFPPSTITKALRQQLNGSETLHLIEELRIELVKGGWTSDPESLSHLDQRQYHHEALHLVITMINCAIDSIGMGGWFLGASALDDSEDKADMIEYMIAEVSAVLQGVQEAAYLAGTLTQILLYGKSVAASLRANALKGTDTAAIAKPVTLSLDNADPRLLPLSLKAPQAIPLTKVDAGGEIQKRSRRDIGRLKSKMVGKYSRERIVF